MDPGSVNAVATTVSTTDIATLIALVTGIGGTGGVGTLFIKAGSYKARVQRTEEDLAGLKKDLNAFKAAQAQAEKDLRRELLDRMDKLEDKLDKLILVFGPKSK